MNKLLFAALLLGCGVLASAQAVRVDPPTVFTTVPTMTGAQRNMLTGGGAGITVCNFPANGAPCTNLATTYQSNNTAFQCPAYAQVTLAGTSSCVATTDSSGRFGFWVSPGNYAYTVSMGGRVYGPYPVSAGAGSGGGTPVVLNGADFGMNCASNTFDNAPAINSMFAAQLVVAAQTNGQGRVVFPPGTCYVGSTINIPNPNIDVSGAGIGATTLEPLPNKGLDQLLLFTGSNIKVHDMTLSGNITNYGISMGVPAWALGGIYNTAATSLGGGPDTVGVLTSPTVLTIYQCIQANTATNINAPPNASYWSVLATLVNSGQQPGGGGALLEFTAPHVDVGHVEMTASQFGIFLVNTTANVSDVNIHDNNCHDFGVQYSGNGSTMDCVHAYGSQSTTGFYSFNLRITNNVFQNIYVPVTGPGYTSAGFLSADDVVFSGNTIINVLNRNGGADFVASGASQTMAQNWTKSNNNITRTLPLGSLNGDQTIGLENEAQQFTVNGNTVVGYQVGIGMTNEAGNTQNGAIAGNVIVGQGAGGGSGATSSGIQFNRGGGGATIANVAAVGNKVSNFYDGIWINPSGATGITIGPNQFDTITHTNIDDTGNFSAKGVVMGTGVNVPTVCDVGSLFYATSGTTNWYGCAATNTWTALGSGGSGGSGTVANGTSGYLAYYPATGTTVSGLTPALGSTQSCGSATTSCQLNFSANGLATGVTSVAISGGGGGGSSTTLTAFQTTQASQVLTANSACASATPCNVSIGGTVFSFTSSATATLSGSTSGTIYEYIDSLGNLTFGSLATLACVNCTYVSGVTAFPANSIPLYTWSTSGGSFTGTNADLRAWISSQPLVAGSNITITQSGGVKTISSSGGGGGTSVSMLPPYIQLGTTIYDGTYQVTLPNFTGWTYDFGTTSNTSNTNGDIVLAQSSSSQAAFFGQSVSTASIEADFSLVGGQPSTEGGIWIFDGTFYWSLEMFNNGASASTSYFLSLNKYNSSGVFSTSTINGIPINGHAILKELVSGTTLTYYVSLNDGSSFLPIATATVGATISRTGLILSKETAGTNYMDVKSIKLF